MKKIIQAVADWWGKKFGIELTDKNAIFALQAQGARVTGAVLPSGYRVPDAPPGKCWVIEGIRLFLRDDGEG